MENEYFTNGMLIVQRIDEILKSMKQTRTDLAKFLDIPPQTISAWSTRGTIPPADIMLKISDYLEVNVYWLVFGEIKKVLPSPEELLLLSKFSRLNETQKKMIVAAIDTAIDDIIPF